MRMSLSRLGFLLFVSLARTQDSDEQCMSKFTQGKEDFVLNTDESVKEGATFLASPTVSTASECVSACCRDPQCNLALMATGEQEGAINSCFIFNCLYKQKKVCRFVRKKGFKNYVLTSAFENYFKDYNPDVEDKPPRAITGQDRVVQPNESVTLNGIESKDDHKIVEYHWDMVSGNPTPHMDKSHFPDQVIVTNMSPGLYKFRLTVTDSAGQSDSAVVTILVLTPEQTHNHCLVPKKEGPCRGSFPRWHYNAATESCEAFTFGGCKPNHNNYVSQEECLNACDKVSALNPSATGGRHGPVDVPTEQCGETCGPEKFTCANKCCIDKELECDQETQCSDGSDEEQCDKLNSKFRSLLDIHVDVDKAHCTQPPVTGPCRASFTKWYYNPYERKCNRYNYGGCEGNDNRFEAEDQCMKVCNGVTEQDAFARRGVFEKQTDDGSTASIGIAVVLGVAILILLAIIGYCFLKSKKQQGSRHQRVAVNGSYSYPVEDTDKFVYNSTTKPI